MHGVDLLRVKTWLGHTPITTTMRYAHLAPGAGEAVKVLDGNGQDVAKDSAPGPGAGRVPA